MNPLSSRGAVVLAVLCISSCSAKEPAPSTPGWKTISAQGAFTMTIPEEMIEQPVKPIDSLVGRYGSSTVTLGYDYGWYSSTLSEWAHPKDGDYVEEQTTIDGRPAKLVFSHVGEEGDFPFVAGVHFPRLSKTEDGETSLTVTLSSTKPLDRTSARRIFTSIRFPTK